MVRELKTFRVRENAIKTEFYRFSQMRAFRWVIGKVRVGYWERLERSDEKLEQVVNERSEAK